MSWAKPEDIVILAKQRLAIGTILISTNHTAQTWPILQTQQRINKVAKQSFVYSHHNKRNFHHKFEPQTLDTISFGSETS